MNCQFCHYRLSENTIKCSMRKKINLALTHLGRSFRYVNVFRAHTKPCKNFLELINCKIRFLKALKFSWMTYLKQ